MSNLLLGDYQLLKTLGKGPLGEVVLTEHRFLKRPYTLKLFSPEFTSDPSFIERLEEEVGGLSSLEHPSIIKIHTVSEVEGHYFLVTDSTESVQKSLGDLKREFTEEEVLQILRQVASALDFAHSKLFFHHGLNLSNILVSQENDSLEVQIADFGLTRIAGIRRFLSKIYSSLYTSLEKGNVALPENASLVQTFLFLAPEQKMSPLESREDKIDAYAFGVLAYYLLTSEFPEGIFEMPSQRTFCWDKLLYSCLQKDPEKRPSSLSQAVEAVLIQEEQRLKPVLKPEEIVRPQFDEDPGAIFQVESVIAKYVPEQEKEKEIVPLLTEMVVISGGSFTRGSNGGNRDELPKHTIVLNTFAIDIHPVTNEQFVRFLEALGGEKDYQNNDIIRLRESRIKRFSGHLNIESGYNKHPVVGVTWYGALAYSKWVGKRLPTEAEWEVASIGGLPECIYPTGNTIDKTQAHFFSSDTASVMSYKPNGYGLYDMAGNVYEWCHDWYDYHYYDTSVQEPKNPKGPLQGVYRVLRGGCWKSLKEDMRCAHRHRNNPRTMNGTYGFRCVADVS